MCEKSIIKDPNVKRVTLISKPDEHGVKRVVSLDMENPTGVIVGKTDGVEGRWSIPVERWNQEDLEKLVGDLEAEQD